ncbi:putative signal recognition particle receptor beta subunit [Lyophyllum shimeji]|uniref:Signal recognition particle receptor subunit beta n=1 Tax=Lyophyllum shimeji TaxID=47721 RepID=A0A9P3UIL9_LYOSH|nr:putative signal recognition particle receptor beta subunit [Lyophyllum shimeji]
MEPSNPSTSGQKAPQTVTDTLMSTQSIALFSLIVSLVLIATIAIFRTRKAKSRGNALLLLGPPDAGKTTILTQLVYGQALQTHTSLQSSSSIVTLPTTKKNIRVVDIPGHPRIRDQFRNTSMTRRHLHNVLHTMTSLPPSQTLPTLVILAHKCDLLNVGSQASATADNFAISRVKTVLERELEKRRVSQSSGVGVEGLGEEGEKAEMGGLDCTGPAGGTFKFAEWEGGEVSFIGTSAKVQKAASNPEKLEEDGLSPLWEWLEENM